MITLTLNIGSLIGILGLATFICDIVALYVHRQSGVYRQQKFQDVDLNLLRLETLNALPLGMMSEESKRKHANHVEQAMLTGHVIDNKDAISNLEHPLKENFQRNKSNHIDLYDDISATSKDMNSISTPMLIYGNYHQQKLLGANSANESPSSSSIKQRRAAPIRPGQLPLSVNEKTQMYDKSKIMFVDDDSPDSNGNHKELQQLTDENGKTSQRHSKTLTPKTETLL